MIAMLKLELNLKRFHNLHRSLLLNNIQGRKRYLSDDSSKQSKTNLYGTLGLDSSATTNDIKKAYYDLSFKYHPDRNKDNVEASDKFREVNEAYEVLGNYGLRKRYDKGMPLPLSKRGAVPIRPIEEFNVPLQKFFDSRQSKSSTKDIFEDDFEPFFKKDKEELQFGASGQTNFDKKFEESKSVRGLITVFLIVFACVFKYYS